MGLELPFGVGIDWGPSTWASSRSEAAGSKALEELAEGKAEPRRDPLVGVEGAVALPALDLGVVAALHAKPPGGFRLVQTGLLAQLLYTLADYFPRCDCHWFSLSTKLVQCGSYKTHLQCT